MAERDRTLLARYLGREVAAQIADAATHPENWGALRMASVLFADIRRFSRLTEQVDLSDLRCFLCDFMGVFVDAVEGAGGVANKFMGDGALALFLNPPDAVAAVRAAFELQTAFAATRAHWSGADAAFADIDLAAGLACGEIFWGNIGAGERFDCTAIGRPVNIAERLAADAPKSDNRDNGGKGGIFCDGDFMARLNGDAPASRSLGLTRLRGMAAETAIFQLLPTA